MNTSIVRGFAVVITIFALLMPSANQAGFELLRGTRLQKRQNKQGRAIGLAAESSLGKEIMQQGVINPSQQLEQMQGEGSIDGKHSFKDAMVNEQEVRCSMNCLQCDQDECLRYNWIGLFCILLLVVNALALLYCLWMTKKIKNKEKHRNTASSILTEQSTTKSIAQFD